MGRETTASVTITDGEGRAIESADEVHVLLESSDVILRGPIRRRLPIAEFREVRALADLLRLTSRDECIEIELPPAMARRWAEKIVTPPPTLAEKLGLSALHPPLLLGRVTDPELQEALADAAAAPSPEAASAPTTIAIAEVDDESDLDAALEQLPPGIPLWLVHRKGRGAWLGDAAIRELMRSHGFIDTKVAVVSSVRTATRYTERRPQRPSALPAEGHGKG